jgi:hypothetical protein
MIALLRGFAYAWTGVLLLVVTAAVVSFVRASDTLPEAMDKLIATFDPFSTANTVLIIVLVLPAFGAKAIADRMYKGAHR